MSREQTPEELRELLGAYALDALDTDERAQVDELLLTDTAARAELHELQQGAAWLGHASLRPPATAWDAIAAEVDQDLAAEAAPVPTASRSHRTSRWLVAAAAVVVLALGAAGVFALVDGGTSSKSITSEYAAAQRDPAASKVVLTSADGRWSARAVVLPDRTAYVADASMPPTASDHDLQLWAITPDGPVSAGLMRGGDIQQFRVARAATELAVTEEPKGGSATPTGAPIVTGEL